MSQWANEHPEQMAEIARLPMREQNAALRGAMGYDPDRIRDEAKERPPLRITHVGIFDGDQLIATVRVDKWMEPSDTLRVEWRAP
jgi:hypothetical protein